MRDGWEQVPLGELVSQRKDYTPVDPDQTYPIVGVQRSGWGFVDKGPIRGSDQKFEKLMQLNRDDLVYRTITAFEAPSAVASEAESGKYVTPQTFPTFTINPKRLLPGYMKLLTSWTAFHDEMAARCTGTVLRRKTLSVKAFSSIPVPLPPILEQERIVDLIAAVDEAISYATSAEQTARSSLGPTVQLMAEMLSSGGPSTLGSHGTFTRGRRFTKADYVDQGLPAIHYGQLYTDLSPVTYEPLTRIPQEREPQMRLARRGDTVIACTSESIEDIGKATAWLGTGPAAVHDDAHIFRHSLDPIYASLLFTMPAFQEQKRKYASGLKVMRISGADLASVELPIPDRSEQQRLAELGLQMINHAALASTAATRLRSLRSNLLTVLLSGEHVIPESYDEMVGVVADGIE